MEIGAGTADTNGPPSSLIEKIPQYWQKRGPKKWEWMGRPFLLAVSSQEWDDVKSIG